MVEQYDRANGMTGFRGDEVLAASRINGFYYQKNILVDSSGNAISSSNPMPVDGGRTRTISANFSRPADTTAYAAGDLITTSTSSGSAVPISFANIVTAAGKGFTINSATLADESAPSVVGVFDLFLYNASPTMQGDNAAYDRSAADSRLLIGKITFDTGTKDTTTTFYQAYMTQISTHIAVGTTLYGLLVVRNAYTPANTGRFDITLGISQD